MPELGDDMSKNARYAAIQSLVSSFLDDKGNWLHAINRQEIADAIADLIGLGKSDGWKLAVRRWQEMITESEIGNTRWALLQGSVMVAHAA